MTDRILAIVALITLIVFLGILIFRVPDIDLIIVTVFVALLACWDFWTSLKPGNGDKPS